MLDPWKFVRTRGGMEKEEKNGEKKKTTVQLMMSRCPGRDAEERGHAEFLLNFIL